ncbi:MAG: PEP-CTERM sorting domain-containing protein [Candidatus Korobacteraceae bacterium]
MTETYVRPVRVAGLCVVVLLVLSVASLSATTLSGNMTADNAFFAYISTDDSVLGTLIASGNDWGTTFSFSGAALTPGVTNYLHVEAINYGLENGLIGDFHLSDSGFYFGNSTQTLLTGMANWFGGYNDDNSQVVPQPWVPVSGGVADLGINGVGPWGFRNGIDPNAHWIWPSDNQSSGCQYCTVDFSTPIYSNVPEPGTFGLIASGVLGLAGMIRKRLP